MLVSCVFFTHKTAYELRISDWSSDVCSSDLQRRQLGHGFILIIKERQHVADNGRGCCHVAAMFKYAGRRIARIVCWRETLKQGMITKFEGQCCIAADTACPFSH